MPHFINSLRIRNFRSIVNESLTLNEESLSIFVGRNDVGKSTVLKALNLFFNGETDADTTFRFEHDYSYNAGTGKGKAKEVLIELTVIPPDRLSNSKPVRWTKTWRGDDLEFQTRFEFCDGGSIDGRSGVHQWLRKLKYRYVPAEKGTAYVPRLMSELHDVLNEVHSTQFNGSAAKFVGEIQDISGDLASELQELIGMSSQIQAPSDFRTLFSSLDFGEEAGGNIYHLRRRGDGIRAWHIPIILKVMARKEQEASKSGRVNPDTVWGFEEPENSLELSNAVKVADQIYSFSKDVQIFLTTHSPAFYGRAKGSDGRAKAYRVTKDASRVSHIRNVEPSDLDLEMGVLDLITPYLKEVEAELGRLRQSFSEVEARAITTPIVILSEDSGNELLKVLARSSGIADFEVFPYHGCGNVRSAFGMARIIQDMTPNVHIVVHRDRDYLADEDIAELVEAANRASCTMFVTEGTDLESHFLNPSYLSAVGRIDQGRAEEYLARATEMTRKKSLDKFSGSVLNAGRPSSTNWTISKLVREYDSDPVRYRHGKTVLKKLKSIFHKGERRALHMGEAHDCLCVSQLAKVGSEVEK